jgi:putative phage-type endonuclease
MDDDLLAQSIALFGEPPKIGHALPTMHEKLGDEAWREQRNKGIGASEAATALGVGWSSRLQLYNEKQGLVVEPFTGNYHTERGHALEPVGLRWFERETGIAAPKCEWSLRHPDFPWMLSNLDGWTGEAPVEVKAPGDYVLGDFHRYVAGEEVSPASEIARYVVQLHHEMIITGAMYGYVVILPGTKQPVFTRVERDEALCSRIFEAERSLWEDHILTGVEPDASGPDAKDIEAAWRAERGDLAAPPTDQRLRLLMEAYELAEERVTLAGRELNEAKRILRDAKAPLLARASRYGAKKLRVQGREKTRTVRHQIVEEQVRKGYSFVTID